MFGSTLVHVSYQHEFVPVVNIDPGKSLFRTRAKTMVKLEFGAMDDRQTPTVFGRLQLVAVNLAL